MTLKDLEPRMVMDAPYKAIVDDTKELSRRLLERMEELNRQFPSPVLEEAIRKLRAMDPGSSSDS